VDTFQLFRVYSGIDCLSSWQQFAMHDTPRSPPNTEHNLLWVQWWFWSFANRFMRC
jgi:hypothetical protein